MSSIARACVFGCLALTSGVIAACAEQDPALAVANQHAVLTHVALPWHRVTLATVAPYDTARLTVDARLGDSTVVNAASGAVITYTVLDSTVTVDQNGLVTARYPTDASAQPAKIFVSVRYAGQTRRDSVQVLVTANVPTPGPFALHLALLPDSLPKTMPLCTGGVAQVVVIPSNCVSGTQPLVAVLTTLQGDSLQPAYAWVSSADSSIATADTGVVTGRSPGITTIYASAYAYGQLLTDSLRFTVTETDRFHVGFVGPHSVDGELRYRFNNETIHIVPGGIVVWDNPGTTPLDVAFDAPPGPVDSADAGPIVDPYAGFFYPTPGPTGSGNVAPFAGDTARVSREQKAAKDFQDVIAAFSGYSQRAYRARKFPMVGIYPFHSNAGKASGVIIVCEELCQ